MVVDAIIIGIHDTDSEIVIPIDEVEADRGWVLDPAAEGRKSQEDAKATKVPKSRSELINSVFKVFDVDLDGRLHN